MKVTRDLVVTNSAGFHLRVASMISKAASAYDSTDISLAHGSYKADCKSCLDLLAIMAPCDTKLTLEVDGDKADEIADMITDMFKNKFWEDEFASAKPQTPVRKK